MSGMYRGVALLALMLFCVTSRASADQKDDAERLLQEGNQLADGGDYGGALEKYRAAHDLYPSPRLLINIGTALRHGGRNAEAAEAYEAFVLHEQAEPEMKQEIMQILKRDIDPLTARIAIVVGTAGATVRVDGVEVHGSSGRHSKRVDPGEHTVTAQKAGYATEVATVRLVAGAVETINLALHPPREAVVIEADAGRTQRVAAYIVGGVGVAGVVVGAALGGVFLSARADAKDHCDDVRCDPEGGEAVDRANATGPAAGITLGVGAAALATGIIVFATSPSDDADGTVALGVRTTASGAEMVTSVTW